MTLRGEIVPYSRRRPDHLSQFAGWRTVVELLRGVLAEVPLKVGEVALGGAQFGFGVAESGQFFLNAFHDPRPGEGRGRNTGGVGYGLESGDLVGVQPDRI